MRTGLFGAIHHGKAVVPGATLHANGEWKVAFGQSTPRHAVQRSVLRQDQRGLHAAHGVWLNAPAHDWDAETHADSVFHLVSDPEAFELVEGPLHGCCWNSESQSLLLHADFARQHPLYWFVHDEGVMFAFSLAKLVEMLRANGLPIEPNEDAAAMLLTYGCVMGDQTLVSGARKLMPGSTLTWTPASVDVAVRSPLEAIARDLRDVDEAIDLLDRTFCHSVRAMVEINQRAGCPQWNLLSGGLDSRLVTMATSELEPDSKCLCFAVRDCRDHEISEQIANDRGLAYHFHDLADGEYMMNTSSVMEYDGCVNYLASAHHRSALESIQVNDIGLLGSGQGANVLLTDHHKWGKKGVEILSGMEWYAGVRDQASSAALHAWDAMPDAQLFKIVNRGFLYTNSGAYSTSEVGVLWSPFVSRAFVRNALRLVPGLIDGQEAYLSWMAHRFPNSLKYRWERYGVPPVRGWRLSAAQVWAKIRVKLGKAMPSLAPQTMSPVQEWHDASPSIQHFCLQTYHDHRHRLELYPSLSASIERDYGGMSMMNKASVITLLLASKALFEE